MANNTGAVPDSCCKLTDLTFSVFKMSLWHCHPVSVWEIKVCSHFWHWNLKAASTKSPIFDSQHILTIQRGSCDCAKIMTFMFPQKSHILLLHFIIIFFTLQGRTSYICFMDFARYHHLIYLLNLEFINTKLHSK